MREEVIAYVVVILLLTLFVGYIFYGFSLIIISIAKSIRDSIIFNFHDSVSGKLKDRYEKYFLTKFLFYDKLPPKLRIKFLLRIRNFIADKSFEGRGNLTITEEMEALVAASAVQLTFGLHKYMMDHFSKIILYPDSYYSANDDAYHMGETNAKGVIVLSWKNLKEGYEKSEDSFNVGLHEMAHALELQLLLQEDYDFFFGNYYPKWSRIAEQEFENIQDRRASFFRKYAGTNHHEFFAVCIEYFFEESVEFKNQLPQIYYHLCILLNQDPLFSDSHVEETKRKTFTELKEELVSLSPVYITHYPLLSISFHYIIIAFVFLMLIVQGFSGAKSLFLLSISAGVLMSALIIFRLNKIILFENYIALQNVFGKIKKIFYIDDIISMSFSEDRQAKFFTVLIANNGKIKKSISYYSAKNSAVEELKQKLIGKNILIKY